MPARAAPTSGGEVHPNPASIAAPPRNAPCALARLNAPCTVAEARVGALRAFCRTRVCTVGTMAKPNRPISSTVTAAVHCVRAVTEKAASVRASSTNDAQTLGRSARSAA